jgi:hypothetical protein
MGCQPQASCGMGGNRQICTSNTDCTSPMYPRCQIAGGMATGTCRAPQNCNVAMCTANGQVCCAGTPVSTCMGTCSAGSQVCATKADCPMGNMCCVTPGMGAPQPTCNAACPTGTNATCMTNADCAGAGNACCGGNGTGGTCQPLAGCGMGGDRQVCMTNADCTSPMYPRCQLGGGATTGTCRMMMPEAGAPEAGAEGGTEGGLLDSGPIDSALPDGAGLLDALTGG